MKQNNNHDEESLKEKEEVKENPENKNLEVIEKLKDLVKKLEEENSFLKSLIRINKERFENDRNELLNIHKRKTSIELINFLENFELSIKVIDKDNINSEDLEEYLKGVKMILLNLSSFLKKEGIEEYSPEIGSEWDYNTTKFVSKEESKFDEENLVVEVVSKGYKLDGKILIKPSVKLSKLKENKEEKK